MEVITDNPKWRLKSLTIELQKWGEFKDKYIGKIQFENKDSEGFMFNLSPERTEKYLSLISEELVANASNLGDKLLQSLNLLPAPKTIELTDKN